MERFNFQVIEKNGKKFNKKKLYNQKGKNFIVFEMFPYPSGKFNRSCA